MGYPGSALSASAGGPEQRVDMSELLAGEGRGAIGIVEGLVTNADTLRPWQKNAKEYFKHKVAGTPDDLIVKPILVEWVNHGLLAGGRFVDEGAGTGWLTNAVAKSGANPAEIYMVDYSHSMLVVAREAISDPRVQLVHAEMSRTPLESGSVDVIGSSNALDCVADLRGSLLEFNRLLRPGGVLVFSVRHPDRNLVYAQLGGLPYKTGYHAWYKEIFPGVSVPVLRRYMSIVGYHTLLKQAGFNEVDMVEPYAGEHVFAIDRAVWELYNEESGRKSAVIFRAVKVRQVG